MEKDIVVISHDRFLTRFYYDSDTNVMGENLFRRFGLPEGIILHKDLAARLYSLVPVLERLHMKFLLTDVYRPVEMQEFLYAHWRERTGAEPKFSLADISKAPHPRGIACDCVLADENGDRLPLPSSSIKVNPEQRSPDFAFAEKTPENAEKTRNRDLLRTLMLCAGISPINKEWFHFQLPQSADYRSISVPEAQSAQPLPYPQEAALQTFRAIFHDYQDDEAEGKTRWWVNDRRYFERFPELETEAFIARVREKFDV